MISSDYDVPAEQELRIEVSIDKKCTVKVTAGFGEIFGCEVAVGKLYEFTQTKFALFTWCVRGRHTIGALVCALCAPYNVAGRAVASS